MVEASQGYSRMYITPARRIRDSVVVYMISPPFYLDEDSYKMGWLVRAFFEAENELARRKYEQKPEEMIIRARGFLFSIASELLAFGRLEMVEHFLENYPYAMKNGGYKAYQHRLYTVDWLIPHPEGIMASKDLDGFREWFQNNQHRLKWSEHFGRFIFSDLDTVKQIMAYKELFVDYLGAKENYVLKKNHTDAPRPYSIIRNTDGHQIEIPDYEIYADVVERMRYAGVPIAGIG